MNLISRLSCLAALVVAGCSDEHKKTAFDKPANPSGRSEVEVGSDLRAPLLPEVAKSFEPQLSLRQRMELIRSLPKEISEGQLDEIFRTLAGPCPKDLSDSDWLVVGNEVLEVLRHRGLLGLETRFADLAADRAANSVMRDYSLQHYLRLQQSRLEAVAKNRKDAEVKGLVAQLEIDIRRILTAEHDGSGSILGTGFMGLGALCRQLDDPIVSLAVTGIVRDLALPLIVQPGRTASVPNITSAIQIAGQLRIPEAEEPIRRLSFSAETDASVKLNSVFALRYYGNQADLVPLANLAASGNSMHHVARESMAQIEKSIPSRK